MKDGTGSDPFAEGEEEEEEVSEEDPLEKELGMDETHTRDREQESGGAMLTQESERDGSDDSPGYVLTRKTVKENRRPVQFHLRDEVYNESELLHEVEQIVGTEVKKTDLREAMIVFAQDHPEMLAQQLNEWGYEHL